MFVKYVDFINYFILDLVLHSNDYEAGLRSIRKDQ